MGAGDEVSYALSHRSGWELDVDVNCEDLSEGIGAAVWISVE